MNVGEPRECANCGAANRTARRFCAQCGAALPVRCPACGFANEPGERFCGGCGGPLATPASAPAKVDTAEAERRPVTVLFADLCGYTRLSESIDPEDVHRLLERYFGVVDAIVERFGGRVDKHIGDAVMAVFGAPIAHGDDPTRAVRAADAIVRAMPDVGAPLGRTLEVHVGLAAGEVVASGVGSDQHRAYTVIGPSVNLAARLVGIAGAGEIVLDSAVQEAVADQTRCVALDAVAIKGIDRPVTAWRLSGLGAGDAGAVARPFVGRMGELAQLAAVIRTCTAGGGGTIVYVRGEPGIGKSRLVAELQRIAEAEGFSCHSGLVLDFGTAKGRDPIRDIVASLVGLPPSSVPEDRERALESAIASHSCAADRRPFLADLLDLPLPEAGRETYQAMDNAARQRARGDVLIGLVDAASRAAPVLVTIEDLHWADRVTLDYIAAFAHAIGRAHVVIALTTRPDGDPLDGGWRASLQRCPLLTLDLAPLSDQDAEKLAAGAFATSGRLAERCVKRAGGNPLFLEQLLRAAEEHEDRLPTSLQSLVLARVDRLPEHDRAALRAAAVIGQRFPLELLRCLIGVANYDCAALLAHYLVRPDGEEFLFAHALIRDGVYASLTRTRRVQLHRTAADWYGERDPSLRAEHLDRAEAPEAPHAYLEAARAQTAALHLERALSLAERGAALARDTGDVVALNLLRGRVHCDVGEGKPAVEAYETALQAAADSTDRCRALIGIAAGHRLTASLDAALAALQQAEPLARVKGLTREMAEIHNTRGNLHFARSEAAACRAEHEAALVCARALGDPAWEARAVSGLADADYADGRMRTAFERFTCCVALCDTHGLTRVAIPNRAMVGHCRIYLNEFDAGVADMEAARALAVRLGDRHGEMFTLESQGLLLTFCDRYSEAGAILERGLALAEAIGARRYQSTILSGMAETALALGRMEEARERIEQALALSRETGMRFCGPLVLGIRARLEDDPRERERCRAEAEALLAQGCVGHNPIGYYRYGIEDALARGDWERALLHASALDAYARAEPLPYTDFLIARGRVLAGLASRPDEPTLRETLFRLRAEAERLRWPIGWPDWAVRAAPAISSWEAKTSST